MYWPNMMNQEPILCQGSASGIMWPDEWTISTVDGGRSAQFEHTVSAYSIYHLSNVY